LKIFKLKLLKKDFQLVCIVMCSAIMAKSYAGNHLLVILVCIYFSSNLYIPECCPGVSTDSILVSIKIIVNQSGYRISYSIDSQD